MSVLAIRLGCVRCPGEPDVRSYQHEWGPDVYLSPGDAGRFFACAVEAAEAIPFAIFYATSIPARVTRYDLDTPRKLIGYAAYALPGRKGRRT